MSSPKSMAADDSIPLFGVAIRRFSVADQVVEELRRRVVTGVLSMGQAVTEAGLAQSLRVSRAPVREAMIQLENDGLVIVDSRGRSTVRQFVSADFEEILTLRLSLETLSVQCAAELHDAADLEMLERNLDDFAQAAHADDLARLDVEFHGLLFRASRHTRLLACWKGVCSQYLVLLTLIYRNHGALLPRESKVSLKAHRAILEAVRERNADRSVELMRQHILDWKEWNPIEALP